MTNAVTPHRHETGRGLSSLAKGPQWCFVSATTIETHGIDIIPEDARKGRARSQFWPWAAGNIHVLSISWGGYLLGFGLSFGQAVVISLLSVVGSFGLVGLISLAGQRGSAPTMVLSRATFGLRGNLLPSFVGYLLVVGWEIVLTALAVMSTASVAERLGIHAGTGFKIGVLVVMEIIVVALGVLGFDAIMASQKYITSAVLVVTALYMALTFHHINFDALGSHPAGGVTAMIGAGVMVFCGFGVGWTSCAADYSRYLPRSTGKKSLVSWTTLGGSVPVFAFIAYGLLLCGSDPALMEAVVANPIGALTDLAPTWFVVPFWITIIAALVAGAVIDIYSSGLALLTMGVPLPRWQTALVDGILVLAGTAYVVWFAPDFLTPFEGFLIALGVPLAAWTGIFGADLVVRWREGFPAARLFDGSPRGAGLVRWPALLAMVSGCAFGFGLVTNSEAPWLGYLLGPLGFGGRGGAWAASNIGVLLTLVLCFAAGWPIAQRARTRRHAIGAEQVVEPA